MRLLLKWINPVYRCESSIIIIIMTRTNNDNKSKIITEGLRPLHNTSLVQRSGYKSQITRVCSNISVTGRCTPGKKGNLQVRWIEVRWNCIKNDIVGGTRINMAPITEAPEPRRTYDLRCRSEFVLFSKDLVLLYRVTTPRLILFDPRYY